MCGDDRSRSELVEGLDRDSSTTTPHRFQLVRSGMTAEHFDAGVSLDCRCRLLQLEKGGCPWDGHGESAAIDYRRLHEQRGDGRGIETLCRKSDCEIQISRFNRQ
jgi:hypothetical protein